MPANEWGTREHPERYLARADAYAHRDEADAALLEQVPADAERILDLGTGNGRVLALLRKERPAMSGVGIDISTPMLEAARERLADIDGLELIEHDLAEPLPALGEFDAVVSSFAIHHLEHDRKRSLYGEVLELLRPGGVFANLEHVASPTKRLHLEFLAAIDEPVEHEDPSDRLLDVETQLRWLRELGFEDVDCFWKWREMAVLAGRRPSAIEVVLDQFAAVNERDFSRAMSLYADDVVLVVHRDAFLQGGTFEGPEAVGRWFGDWFATFEPGYRFEVEEVRDLGGLVFLSASHHGRGRTSGIEVSGENGYLYRVRNGKVVSVEIFAGPAEALAAARDR